MSPCRENKNALHVSPENETTSLSLSKLEFSPTFKENNLFNYLKDTMLFQKTLHSTGYSMSINILMYINLASKPETQMIGSLNILLNGNRMRRNCRNWEQRWKWRSAVNINAFKPPGSLEPSLLRELKGFTASTALNGCEHELSAKLLSNIPNHNIVKQRLVYLS